MPWIPPGAVLLMLVAGALVLGASIAARREHWVAGAIAISIAALLVRGYAASDRELHPYDERYHALVAKHLIDTPLVPTLYSDPVLPYDYRDWKNNHIWLHKPPLTMWMQAASMWLFGVAELPMRLPSIVFSTASVLMTFAIGVALFSPQVGLVAAAFQAFNGFLVDLVAGRRPSDHVDTLVICLVELAILAAIIAAKRRFRFGGFAVGIVCGLALLTKSFPALLILPIWVLIRFQDPNRERIVRDLIIAGVMASIVALPWILYSMNAFPQEWAYENTYAWRHATEVLETHGGPPWQYVTDMPRHFGELIYVPLLFAIGSLFTGKASPAQRVMLVWIAVPYLLFSAMATKMSAYVMLAAPAVFLLEADFWLTLQRWRAAENTPARRGLLLVAAVILAVLPARHLLSPTGPLEARDEPQEADDMRELNSMIGVGKAVIFNVPAPIEAMFYSRYIAYERVPTGEQIAMLHDRGYRVYLYDRRTPEHVPGITRLDITGF